MSTIKILPAPLRAVVTPLLLALAAFWAAPGALAQPNAFPPEFMTYQGFLADGNGGALATNAPQNYDVEFRIFALPTGGDALWGEQQTVTVDKGNFSVLLGEGGITTPAELRPALSTLFTNTTASDRFVEMTVKGIGTGGGNVTMLPRLRLLTSPYAFLAKSANKLVSSTGGDLITSSGSAVIVNGTVTATSFTGSGANLTSLNANKITTGMLGTAQIPSLDGSKITGTLGTAQIPSLDGSKINVGTLPDNRLTANVALLNRSSQRFTGAKNSFSGYVGIGTSNPEYPIHVTSSFRKTIDIDSYSEGNWVNPTGLESRDLNVAIYAYESIVAQNFQAKSDARMKDVVGISESASDLSLLQQIEVTDYRYRDWRTKGRAVTKKVIAQQVEKVFPQAVSRMTNVVPDIYENATVVDGWVTLATDLKKGERVRLIADGIEGGIHEVLEVVNGKFRTDFKPEGDKVFVFGREVNDFRAVDYEAIAMLNVSATQELAKRLEKLEKRETHLAELEQKAARVDSLERDVADLKKLVAQLAESNKSAKQTAQAAPASPASAAVASLQGASATVAVGR